MGQALMDQYFKTLHAHEEIIQLNIEICHVIIHLHDEARFLEASEAAMGLVDPVLAQQVQKY